MKQETKITKENIKKWLRWFFFSFIWVGVLLFVVDLVTKQVIMANCQVGQDATWYGLIPSDGSFLAITYIQNSGMAFGLKFNSDIANTIVFISVSLIGTAVLIFVFIKFYKKLNNLTKIALMLLLSGCVGNLIDRSFYVKETGEHFVVDWIAFFGKNGFARFNIADACLTIGAFIFIVYLLVCEFKEAKKARDKTKLEMKQQNEDKKD